MQRGRGTCTGAYGENASANDKERVERFRRKFRSVIGSDDLREIPLARSSSSATFAPSAGAWNRRTTLLHCREQAPRSPATRRASVANRRAKIVIEARVAPDWPRTKTRDRPDFGQPRDDASKTSVARVGFELDPTSAPIVAKSGGNDADRATSGDSRRLEVSASVDDAIRIAIKLAIDADDPRTRSLLDLLHAPQKATVTPLVVVRDRER